MSKVFISYHRADTKQRKRLIYELERNDIAYYAVPEDANYNGIHNQEICKQILKEIDACDCVICLIGKETYSRPHVDHELKYALHKRKGIVALLIENRRDSIYKLNKETYPARLNANEKYIVLSQFASGLETIEQLLLEATKRSKSNIGIDNSIYCMKLRNKYYYDN